MIQNSNQARDGFGRPALLGQSDGILLPSCQNRDLHDWRDSQVLGEERRAGTCVLGSNSRVGVAVAVCLAMVVWYVHDWCCIVWHDL